MYTISKPSKGRGVCAHETGLNPPHACVPVPCKSGYLEPCITDYSFFIFVCFCIFGLGS